VNYAYQAVETGSGNVVTWTSATPDLTGVGSGTAVDVGSVVQTNCPGPADGTNGFAWSGVGITGSVLPEDVVLGAGLNGSWDLPTATLTVTGRSILDFYDASTSAVVAENVERIYLYGGLTMTPVLPGVAVLSANQLAIHAPVHGVTVRNLSAASGGGLVKPDNAVEITEYRNPDTVTLGWVSNYDAAASTLATNDRVLVANQTTASENGIYIWNGTKLVASTEVITAGHSIPVTNGEVWAGTLWSATTATAFLPALGTPTDSIWYLAAKQNEPVEATRWIEIGRLAGPSGTGAGDKYLRVDLDVSTSDPAGNRRVAHALAYYRGNASGDMTPMGDDLNNQLHFAWELPATYIVRVTVDGSELLLEALAEEGLITTPGTQVSISTRAEIKRFL
jgi:hypothetical protein